MAWYCSVPQAHSMVEICNYLRETAFQFGAVAQPSRRCLLRTLNHRCAHDFECEKLAAKNNTRATQEHMGGRQASGDVPQIYNIHGTSRSTGYNINKTLHKSHHISMA